ncbi:hypothetical protein QTH97_34775 [Variovorax sp. J22R24]|uniref:hypothetical protein n=1 Tax=Variovorax gracilis TaxID=3053502 RepID=UPI00257647C3|nr:hypothetical protein [Variovorax sp. J22R24]MDM0110108.1 hypothetical protein [Variovorax sp. J22R24]
MAIRPKAEGPVLQRLRAKRDAEAVAEAARLESLRKEYGEVASNFRTLTDIRFRLLALLPIAAAATAALTSKNILQTSGFLLALFGLVATIGVATYNERNNQLYNELVGRAAAIERAIGVPDGAFAHRPKAWLTLSTPISWKVEHDNGIALIYGATICLWLTLLFAPVLEVCRVFLGKTWPQHFGFLAGVEPRPFVYFGALFLAVLSTSLFAWRFSRQMEVRRAGMRELAKRIVDQAKDIDLADRPDNQKLMELCADLFGGRSLIDGEQSAKETAKKQKRKNDGTEEKMRRRAKAYRALDPVELRTYIPAGSPDKEAAHWASLLCDLPPMWIHDCYTGRRS